MNGENQAPVYGDELEMYEDTLAKESSDSVGVSPIFLEDEGEADGSSADTAERYTDDDGDYQADGYTDDEGDYQADGYTDGGGEADIMSDLAALRGEFPELYSRGGEDILKSKRYLELRALGLTAREAYLAITPRRQPRSAARPAGAAPRPAHSPTSGMSGWEIKTARSLFEGLGDREIQRLYRKVTK